MGKKGRVFIAQRPSFRVADGSWASKYDLSPATKHGTIVEVLPPSSIVKVQDVVGIVASVMTNLGFTEDDYVLPLGDPVASSLVFMMAAARNHGRVKVLRWNRHTTKYLVEQVEVDTRFG